MQATQFEGRLGDGIQKKLDFLGNMFPIRKRWGGVDPLLQKKLDFFQTKCEKYLACPENPFSIRQLDN